MMQADLGVGRLRGSLRVLNAAKQEKALKDARYSGTRKIIE